jgi:outer membrane receptor protein involved in Fe transport
VSRATSDGEQPHPAARQLAVCILCGLFSAWTHGARANTELSIDIPAQPVADALAEFADQTGLQFVYESRIVSERGSRGARAGSTPEEALRSILDGTGLDFQYLNRRTVRVFETVSAAPTAPSNAAAAPTTRIKNRAATFRQLDEVTVPGSRTVHGLGDTEDIRTVAASVSIVSGESLEAQKLEQLSDYAAYLPGVNSVGFGAPGLGAVILRGITSFPETATGAFYLDDTPIGPNGPWADACCEVLDLMPYDLERVEVRRGPQGTHYGANSQSGLIRYVLTEPSVSEFEARVGADASAIYGASEAGASLRAMVNAPIVENVLAVRVSA